MELKDLPAFLLKPVPRSRVKGHVQTLAMFNLRTDTGFEIELAVCENVFSQRRKSATTGEWDKWADERFADHDKAVDKLKTEVASWTSRKYYSIVDTGLLLPLNETDVRHLRNDGMLPRAMLEYGSELYAAMFQWREAETAKRDATLPTPTSPVTAPPVPRPGSATASTGPSSTPDLDDVLGKLRARSTAVGGV